MKIAVAMSGGVDSSLAVLLLKQQGYEVIGITMDFKLTGSTAVKDAKAVAKQLGIKHRVFEFKADLETKVMRNFCREYSSGRTPNPCVWCNYYIKFGGLLKKAFSLGAISLATGHYAVVAGQTGRRDNDAAGFALKKARDPKKDQSYFLYRLKQDQLKHIIFPLGGYTKAEVRQLAKKNKLSVADKSDSQEICFLQNTDYRVFLKSRLPRVRKWIGANIKPGLVVDKAGKVLGIHQGIPFYTIGQRAGLGIACGYPVYITRIDPGNNKIIVGNSADARSRDFLVKNLNFIRDIPKKKIALKVKIRYNHQEAEAIVGPYKDGFRVKFNEPQFAITPGQSAVFYRDDEVIGGGIIDEVVN